MSYPIPTRTGRSNESKIHSIFRDNQELRSLQPQFKGHENILTTRPQRILNFFFTIKEIKSAAYMRHSKEETVPFYLIRLHPEITMTISKREIMNEIFTNPLERDKYEALTD